MCCVQVIFLQAEDGIRGSSVTGVQTCALPILHARPVELPRRRTGRACTNAPGRPRSRPASPRVRPARLGNDGDRKSAVEGKRVDLGGRRIIKKKKTSALRDSRWRGTESRISGE